MHYLRSIPLLALLGLVLAVLAGCAPGGSAGTTGNAGSAVNSPVSSPTGTATATPPVGRTPSAGPPTAGAVTLVLNQTSYGSNDTIHVTIRNGLKTTIYTADHRTDCMLVQLERQSADTWQAVAPCRLEIVTKIVSLAAGSSTPQLLAPVSTSPGSGGSWPAGTYRIAFGYGAGSQAALTQQTVVYSATFVVR
ncbi:MAG TPA: hypothetical protein VKT82_24080 [Ktedonobacterales bacterium]|nr:hypothetical protein [Ktedonobacterales bacterium]